MRCPTAMAQSTFSAVTIVSTSRHRLTAGVVTDLIRCPQRRDELEKYHPELRRIESDEELQRKYEFFLSSRSGAKHIEQIARAAAGEQVEWQADYLRGRHTDGEAGTPDHQTRRHLRSFVQQAPAPHREKS